MPPRSTSRSAPAGCRCQQPGAQAPRKTPVFDEEETAALAAYVASLGTGPAIPEPIDYDLDTYLDSEGLEGEERAAAREASIVRGGQIFLSNCTACHNFEGSGGAMPRGGQAPKIRGVDPKHIYEAMLTGPQSMDTFSNGNLPPDAKRDVIAYLNELDETARLRRLGIRRSRAGGRGTVGLAGRYRPAGRVRRLDRLPLDALDEAAKQGSGRVSDAHDDNLPALPDEEPIANPGLPEHTWRPTDVDPAAEKRAERQVAAFFGASSLFAVLFVVAFSSGRRQPDTSRGFEARQPHPRPHPRRSRCSASASGSSTGPAS